MSTQEHRQVVFGLMPDHDLTLSGSPLHLLCPPVAIAYNAAYNALGTVGAIFGSEVGASTRRTPAMPDQNMFTVRFKDVSVGVGKRDPIAGRPVLADPPGFGAGKNIPREQKPLGGAECPADRRVIPDGCEKGGRWVENPEFLRFSHHWDSEVRACRPDRAQTKGKVERPIRDIRPVRRRAAAAAASASLDVSAGGRRCQTERGSTEGRKDEPGPEAGGQLRDCRDLPEQGRAATGELGDPRVAGGSPVSKWPARGGSCGGVLGMSDGAEERVAGALDGLGRGGVLVERFDGEAASEEGFGTRQGSEPLVRRGDIFLPVACFDTTGGVGDQGGEEAGPVDVEDGTEGVVEEVVAVVGPGPGEGADVELVEQAGDLAVDVFAAVVGVAGLGGEGEAREEGFEGGDGEVPGDAGDGAKVLELRHIDSDVDEVDALPASPVADIGCVDGQEAGLAAGAAASGGPRW